jgi:hypothetical protein
MNSYIGVSVRTCPIRVHPKVSGLSQQRNKQQQQQKQTLIEKQHKGLWRQNSLD